MKDWSKEAKIIFWVFIAFILIGVTYYFGWFGGSFSYKGKRILKEGSAISGDTQFRTSSKSSGLSNPCGSNYVSTYPLSGSTSLSCAPPDDSGIWLSVENPKSAGKFCCWRKNNK